MEPEYYDWTMLNAFQGCNALYKYRYEDHLVIEHDTPRWPLEFGIALHTALERYYRSRMDGVTLDDEAVVGEFIKAFPNDQPGQLLKSGRTNEGLYTKVRGSFLLLEYIEQWKEQDEEHRVVDVEIGAAELLSEDVAVCGRLDLVWEEDGGVRMVDHKSTSRMERMMLNPNLQLMGYQWLLERYFGKVAGVCVDVIGVYKTKPLGECFDRQYEQYNEYQMGKWAETVIELVRRIRKCRALGVWPLNSGHCGAYAGRCAYMPLCSSPDELGVETLKDSMYVRDKWEPYKKEKE